MSDQDDSYRQSIKAAKNGGWQLIEKLDAALAAGEINEQTWYQEITAVITAKYLAADNPRGQSGHSGDEAHWQQARGSIIDAINKNGAFLDVGCASGYLMESVYNWAGQKGWQLELFGLEISPELAALARRRLPQWAEKIYTGNIIDWQPPRQFDFVRTGLEYVPKQRRQDLIKHLLNNLVAPGGRLIIGVFNEEKDQFPIEPPLAEIISAWGYKISGYSRRDHYTDARIQYCVLWIEHPD